VERDEKRLSRAARDEHLTLRVDLNLVFLS
jgi:hypothetical protein